MSRSRWCRACSSRHRPCRARAHRQHARARSARSIRRAGSTASSTRSIGHAARADRHVSPIMLVAAMAKLSSPGRSCSASEGRARRPGLRGAQVPDDARSDAGRAGRVRRRSDEASAGRSRGADRRTRHRPFLRRAPIDEMPQLFNVLHGEMSWSARARSARTTSAALRRGVYRYADRHRVKSGITGWSQVSGSARQDLDRRPRRVGQLLHRELVALARPEDHPDDRPGCCSATSAMTPDVAPSGTFRRSAIVHDWLTIPGGSRRCCSSCSSCSRRGRLHVRLRPPEPGRRCATARSHVVPRPRAAARGATTPSCCR